MGSPIDAIDAIDAIDGIGGGNREELAGCVETVRAVWLTGEEWMPVSRAEKEFVDYLVDMMQGVGPVSARAMFGGHGIYLDGLMFGLVAHGTLYLKADRETAKSFAERGLEPFTYGKNGKRYKMSYFEAPEEALEDREEMTRWANRAYGIALRAAAKKRRK